MKQKVSIKKVEIQDKNKPKNYFDTIQIGSTENKF